MKRLGVGILIGLTLATVIRYELIRYSGHGLPKPDYMGVKFLRSVRGVEKAWGIA